MTLGQIVGVVITWWKMIRMIWRELRPDVLGSGGGASITTGSSGGGDQGQSSGHRGGSATGSRLRWDICKEDLHKLDARSLLQCIKSEFGSLLVLQDSPGFVCLIDLDQGVNVVRLALPDTTPFRPLQLSPDGKLLLHEDLTNHLAILDLPLERVFKIGIE
jgi:hypothetical protein